MSYFREPSSLDEALREERRLAAAMRRRRLKRWLIPVLIGVALLGGLIFLLRRCSAGNSSVPSAETVDTPADATATLVAAGDIRLDAQMLASLSGPGGFDFTECFSGLTGAVAAGDVSIVNIEGNFCGPPYGSDNASYPESLLTALHQCGFNVVQTANSYSIANGLSGLVSTKQAIEAAGMDALGTFVSAEDRESCGGVLIKDANGIRIALIGITKGTNGLHLPEGAEYCVNLMYEDYDTTYSKVDTAGMRKLVDRAKGYLPDVIVCMVHWGSENTTEVTDAQRDIADFLFDLGVDVIIGTHSHLVGPIEGPSTATVIGTRENGLIAYSLGDLMSSSEKENTHTGCLLSITFEKTGGRTKIASIQYFPTYSAYPSAEYEQDDYRIYDSLLEIRHYESSHYEHVSTPMYEHLLETVETLQERTASEYLGKT